MTPFEIVLGVLIIVLAIVISVLVLLQQGKNKNLSGAISGGTDSFFSKSNAGKKDKLLAKLTLICSIVFAVLIIVMYVIV